MITSAISKVKTLIRDRSPLIMFLFAFNAASLFRKNTPRCSYSIKSGAFKLNKSMFERIASTRSRALTYYDGFNARSNYIAKTYFIDKIQFLPGDIVLDCGTNMGDLLLWFELNKIEIEYYGFEPNPIDYAALVANATGAHLFNIGLWNTDAKLDFYLSTEAASSSFIEPPYFSDVIEIQSRRLDSIIPPREIKLLKLEAEGAEPEVLEGAQDLLPLIAYIAADVGPERGPNELSTRDDVVSFLESNNFEILSENSGHRKTILFVNKKYNSTLTSEESQRIF